MSVVPADYPQVLTAPRSACARLNTRLCNWSTASSCNSTGTWVASLPNARPAAHERLFYVAQTGQHHWTNAALLQQFKAQV